jgi:hypothetical protein
MPGNPLDNLCDAIRALPPLEAQQALSELYRTRIINLRDAMECGRALTILRVMVDKRDARKKRPPSN